MRLKRRRSTFGKTGKHHVGLDRTGINRDLRQFSKHLGEAKRIFMIFGEAFDMMVKRINRSGGENADLAHAAAHKFACSMRTADHVLRARQHRSGGSAKAFRKTQRNGVDLGQHFYRVETPSLIQAFISPAPSK